MNESIKLFQDRLNSKKEEYEKKMEYFTFSAGNESKTGCYERNAIGDLAILLELKAEIKELEFVLKILKANEYVSMRNMRKTITRKRRN